MKEYEVPAAAGRKIDRKKLVNRYHPKLDHMDTSSPLTVGNGEFAFTADITGLQSLYDGCRQDFPLCTMSQWGWHTEPVSETQHRYTLEDLEMTEFAYRGRTVKYPKNKMPGNEEVYRWLRQNPHRLNLGRIGLLYRDQEIDPSELSEIHQELNLYEGRLESRYCLAGTPFAAEVCCDSGSDTLGIRLRSGLLADRSAAVCLAFPYGSPDITASDWKREERHTTRVLCRADREILLERTLDKDRYYVRISSTEAVEMDAAAINRHILKLYASGDTLEFTVSFTKIPVARPLACGEVFKNAEGYWRKFWENGGMVQVSSSTDSKASELQRRIILSMYLLAVNCSGSMPPQETGLACNSWYGKFHLEMHFWHSAWAPLWNRPKLLESSLSWYSDHRMEARENALRNGFDGIRWPKMTAYDCADSPSDIAPMLIWQQPHIIMMLELLYRNRPEKSFLEKYWEVVKQTAQFMADFAVYDESDKKYDLLPPLIPVQECHRAEDCKNPAFELEYWRYGLSLAAEWAKRLGEEPDPKWTDVCMNMREPRQEGGVYLAHENCRDTFTVYNTDHPSMLGMLGVLPSGRIDKETMGKTLDKVLDIWQFETLWGWDFAVMAMTAARLGRPELAAGCLMMETEKNDYVLSGHNRQKTRKDLPLYLPGNGSLLLAVGMLAAGCDGSPGKAAGFPDSWDVICEDINPYV